MADQEFEAAAAELRRALDERLERYLGRIGEVVFRAVTDVLHSQEFAHDKIQEIAKAVWFDVDWIYENQDPKIPDAKKARDKAFRSVQAGNGQIFHPGHGLGALGAKLDKLPELVAAAVAQAVKPVVVEAPKL